MSFRSPFLVTVTALAAGLLTSSPSLAQFTLSTPESSGFVVSPDMSATPANDELADIVVEGNQRIEAATVRAYMSIKPGDRMNPDRIDASLKSLFATGLFADVSIRRDGRNLIVHVVENPIVNRIAFEGNRRIDDDALQAEVQLRPRQVYTRSKVQEDVKRILDIYRRSGRFAVTVDPKIIELDQNRVDLAFEINEGPSTYIRRINFVGNKHFDDSALREAIISREERWYRFLASTDTYDPDRLTYDRELLRRFYLRKGYADFRVASAVAELSADRESFFVTFTVDEGDRYKFGDMDVNVSLPDADPETLRALIAGEKGDWYNADRVEDTVQAMTDALGAMGYAFVDVRPRVRRDRDNNLINITYDIQEGPKVFVDRIDITGNVRTLDRVIRREMQLVEGDAFNTAKLRRSRERIQNLDFFDKVDVTNVPSETAPDRTVIQVNVEEKSTGSLSFGVGWSSTGGALFDTSLRERNLLGKGQDLSLSLTLAERKQEIDLRFTEPYFLDRPLAAGFDVFLRQRDLQDEASYDVSEKGAALRLGFRYNDRLSQSLRYQLSETTLEDLKTTVSRYIRQQEGRTVLSQISQSITYDRRDSTITPTEGYYARLSNDLAGAGGDEKFLRTTVDGGQYFTLTDDVVLGLSGTVGSVFGLGEDVRYVRNFQLGGDNLRGFEYGGASPRDRSSDDILGGRWIATGSAEIRFPLGLPEELGITGKTFSDVGMIGTPDNVPSADLHQSETPRLSAGVGLIWNSPMGPVSIDLAQAFLKEDFDRTEFFRFNFGARF